MENRQLSFHPDSTTTLRLISEVNFINLCGRFLNVGILLKPSVISSNLLKTFYFYSEHCAIRLNFLPNHAGATPLPKSGCGFLLHICEVGGLGNTDGHFVANFSAKSMLQTPPCDSIHVPYCRITR